MPSNIARDFCLLPKVKALSLFYAGGDCLYDRPEHFDIAAELGDIQLYGSVVDSLRVERPAVPGADVDRPQ